MPLQFSIILDFRFAKIFRLILGDCYCGGNILYNTFYFITQKISQCWLSANCFVLGLFWGKDFINSFSFVCWFKFQQTLQAISCSSKAVFSSMLIYTSQLLYTPNCLLLVLKSNTLKIIAAQTHFSTAIFICQCISTLT